MDVTLQYFDDCPNWKVADERLRTALAARGLDAGVRYEVIDTPAAAQAAGFRGSPTILIDGVDAFGAPDAPIGLACRIYETPQGRAESPTVDQLIAVLAGTAG